MKAIRAHGWTFVGTREFEPQGAWRFTIDRARADTTIMPPDSLFNWCAAAIERLYQRLMHSDTRRSEAADEPARARLRFGT
ncbi:MAG: hypothetical protein AAF559_09315 [Pseudomonadota bacterium]